MILNSSMCSMVLFQIPWSKLVGSKNLPTPEVSSSPFSSKYVLLIRGLKYGTCIKEVPIYDFFPLPIIA